ncbi:hypothetical protein T10_11723 [Trichinella papuae]|uniref:Uncharacterized protein n=1 Tax=Trichinella papuae TaxID=268474 RepID=A0A0V1MJW5_9BILA|nr:hypothetical protein T10_11723 [Trichinella papuae]
MRKLGNGEYGAGKPNNNKSFMEFIKCEFRRYEKSADEAHTVQQIPNYEKVRVEAVYGAGIRLLEIRRRLCKLPLIYIDTRKMMLTGTDQRRATYPHFRPKLKVDRDASDGDFEPERRDARWLESLAELEFNIEHRLVRIYGDADALSRKECQQCMKHSTQADVCAILHQPTMCRDADQDKNQANSKGKVRPKQASDAEIQLLKNSIGNLGIDNGLLLCQRKISTKGEDRTEISVPRSFRSEVLCSLLDRTCADHLEEKRTLARVVLFCF